MATMIGVDLEGCGTSQPVGVPEIQLVEKGICRSNKAQSGFNGCEGPQSSRSGTIFDAVICR
jgi:hypothetical protein